jgi:hypothetical protein
MKAFLETPDTVCLTWELLDKMENWNAACSFSIEQFGLPRDRFKTELTADWMKFKFNSPHDATIMALRFA